MATSFNRPSLPDLIARVVQQIQANLPGTDPALTVSVCGVVGTVLAQELFLEYGYLDQLVNWFFVQTAPGDYLDLRGGALALPRYAAVPAAGNVIFSGVPGYSVPAGSVLATADSSQSYAVSGTVAIGAGGTVSGAVVAVNGGLASDQPAGAVLNLSVALAGVNAQGGVDASGLNGGADRESDSLYRGRILARMQLPPQGGAARDYVAWAKQYAGVTRVWVYPLNRGAGTVDVACVFDGRAPGSIIATTGDNTGIAAVLQPLRPVTASVGAIALTADVTNVVINNLVPAQGYTKAQALAAATVSLQGLFAATTPGGAGYGDGLAAGATAGVLLLEQISDAITQSAGVGGFDLGAPSADIASASGHLAVLGSVTAP